MHQEAFDFNVWDLPFRIYFSELVSFKLRIVSDNSTGFYGGAGLELTKIF